jgi:peptidoglycan/LPS O-acetylase OafA/YrhL
MLRTNNKIQLIQHLRAISVLLVLFYHMGLPIESGFLGVDIFFFISGYIITYTLDKKYSFDKKSLLNFYKNRFWRLFPTLISILIVTLMLSVALQSLQEIYEICKNTISGFFGLSNFAYYRQSGIYGTSSTDNNPLIHLWSLSVEFQFYLIYPVIYLLLKRFSERVKILVLFTFFIIFTFFSIFISDIAELKDHFSNINMLEFYLTPFRIFEFISGALAYQINCTTNIEWNKSSKITSIGSIFLLALVFFSTNVSDTNRQYKVALMMLLLLFVVVFSSNKPSATHMRGRTFEELGNLAYPLYLLHLPLITLSHIHFPQNKFVPIYAGFLALFFSIFIHRMVEEKQIKQKNKTTILLLTAILFIPCIGVITATKFTNLEVRNNNSNLFSSNNATFYFKSKCRDESTIASDDCRWNFAKDDTTVFVAGDSQAVHALDAIIPAAKNVNINVVLGARKGCPFFDTTILIAPTDKCYYVREQVWDWIEHNKPEFVVIANLSTGYLKTSRVTISNPGGKCPDINGVGCKGYESAIYQTVKRLIDLGSKPIILQTIPNYTNQYQRSMFDLFPDFTSDKSILFLEREPSYISEITVQEALPKLSLVDPFNYLCDDLKCELKREGNSLYADAFHISTYGAGLLVPEFVSIFDATSF